MYSENIKTEKWLREEAFKTREDIVQGLEKFPEALLMIVEERISGS